MSRSAHATPSPAVPASAAILSIACFAAAVGVSVYIGRAPVELALLPWLLALVPAFLLAYHRGWKGAAIALELGMIGVLVVEIVHIRRGDAGFHTPLIAVLLLLFVTVCFGAGWIAELLRRQRELAEMNAAEAIFMLDPEGRIRRTSPSVERILGYSAGVLDGTSALRLVHPEDQDRARAAGQQALDRPGTEAEIDLRVKDHAGAWRIMDTRFRCPRADRHRRGVLVSCRDVTARRRLEDRLRRAGRMESIGRLTGGVAHDFNNILTAVAAQCAFLLEATPEDDPRRPDIQGIVTGAERARDLTRQLLAFSRQQVLKPHPVDLDELVTDVVLLLRRTVKENVTIAWLRGDQPNGVLADPTQVRQVVINLIVNAAEAMPSGGTLEVRTRAVHLDDGFAGRFPYLVRTGDYIELTVSDTGVGIDPALAERVFEPFFTTKGAQGTGMGLSTVYGIVKQSGGYIWLDSRPGRGTTATVVLPAHAVAVAAPAVPDAPDAPASRGPTYDGLRILVVEDDTAVRGVIERTLGRAGHEVAVAANATTAVSTLRGGSRFDLLLTDVVMPGMDGFELAARSREIDPSMRRLLMSGYTWRELEQFASPDGPAFLQKPFTPAELLRAVAAACASSAAPA